MDSIINNYLSVLNNRGRAFCDYSADIFIQSSVLIILLLLIDFLLRKRVRATFRYWIWMLVFVKLMLPPTLSLPTGIGYWCGDYLSSDSSVLKQTTVVSKQEYIETPVMRDSPATSEEPYIHEPSEYNDTTKAQDSIKSVEIPQSVPPQTVIKTAESVLNESPVLNPVTWQAIVFLTWFIGVLIISVLLVQRALFVRGLITRSEPSDESLVEIMNQCRSSLGIRRNIELRISGSISSPSVCGLFMPVILMPPDLVQKLSPEKLRAVLIHELAHIKRGDLWVNLAQTVLQIVYFYNPLIWLVNAVVRRIREQAVDEMVLVALGAEAKSYSNTLIDIAEMAFVRTSLSLRLIGVVESKKALHNRIKLIINRPIPKKAKLGILGALIVIIIGAILLPMAKSMQGPPGLVIKGVVKDAYTNEPIAGAKVFDDDYANEPLWEQIRPDQRSQWGAITNENGQYSFLTWPEHRSIKVEAPGYKPKSRNLYSGHFVLKKKDIEVFDFALEQVKKSVNDRFQIYYDYAGLTQITVKNGKLEYIWHTLKKDLIALRQDLSSYDRHELSKELTPTDLNKFEKWIDDTGLFSLPESFVAKEIKTYGSAFETRLKVISGNKQYDATWTGDSKLTKEIVKARSQLILICDNLRISNLQFVATLPNGITVELIGVCEHPSKGKQWWRPDGSVMSSPLHNLTNSTLEFDPESESEIEFDFLIKPAHDIPLSIRHEIMKNKKTFAIPSVGLISQNEQSQHRCFKTVLPKSLSDIDVAFGIKYQRLRGNDHKWVIFKNVSLQPGQKTDVQIEVEKPQSQKFRGSDLNVVQKATSSTKLPDLFEKEYGERFIFPDRIIDIMDIAGEYNPEMAKALKIYNRTRSSFDEFAINRIEFTEQLYIDTRQKFEELAKTPNIYPVNLYARRWLIIIDWVVGKTDTLTAAKKITDLAEIQSDIYQANFTKLYAMLMLLRDGYIDLAHDIFLRCQPELTPQWGWFVFELNRHFDQYVQNQAPNVDRVEGNRIIQRARTRQQWLEIESPLRAAQTAYADYLEFEMLPMAFDYIKSNQANKYSHIERLQLLGTLRYIQVGHHRSFSIGATTSQIENRFKGRIHPKILAVWQKALQLMDNQKDKEQVDAHLKEIRAVCKRIGISDESLPGWLDKIKEDKNKVEVKVNFENNNTNPNIKKSDVKVETDDSDNSADIQKENLTDLRKVFSVYGIVTDEQGNPIPDVKVSASCGMDTLFRTGETTTGDDGHYKLYFGPGMHFRIKDTDQWGVGFQAATIYAQKPDLYEADLCQQGHLAMSGKADYANYYQSQVKYYKGVVLPDKPYRLDFVMLPTATIRGKLVDKKGNPVGDKEIWLTGDELYPSTSVLRTMQTDNDGMFMVDSVPCKSFWFTHRYKRDEVRTRPINFSNPVEYKITLVYDKPVFRKPTLTCISVKESQAVQKHDVQVNTEEVESEIPKLAMNSINTDGKYFWRVNIEQTRDKELLKTLNEAIEPFEDRVGFYVRDYDDGVIHCVDFDKNRIIRVPDELDIENREAILKWVKENNIDAMIRKASSLVSLDMSSVIIDSKEWNKLSVSTLKKLEEKTIGSADVLDSAGNGAVFHAFRTSQGRIGVMKLSSIENNEHDHRSLLISYKLLKSDVQVKPETNWVIEDYGQTRLLLDKEKPDIDNWVSIWGGAIKNRGRYLVPDRGLTLKDLIKAAGYNRDKLAQSYIEVDRRTRQGNITARSVYSRNLKTLLSGEESDVVLKLHDTVSSNYIEPSANGVEFWSGYHFDDVVGLTVNDDGAKVDMYGDLDSGKLITPPDTLNNNDENAVLRWIKDNGIDVMGETADSVHGLVGFNMYAAHVDNYFWDAALRGITDRLMVRIDDPVLLSVENLLPVTYLIKTSKYKMGILQILGFTENSKGIKIRYKLLNKEAVPKPDRQPDNVSLVGGWQYIGQSIPPDFNDTMILAEHINLGSIGHDAEGKTFITFVRDGQEAKNQQYRFVLFTKDGDILEPDGHIVLGEGKRLEEKFTFDGPFITRRLKGFRFQARALLSSEIEKASSQLKKSVFNAVESQKLLLSDLPPPGRYAVELDGIDDYLLVPDSPSLRLEPPFTIEMWIKTKLPPDANEYHGGWALISKGFTVGTPRAYLTGFGINLHRFPNEPSNLHIDFCKANNSGTYSATYAGYPLKNGFSDWIHITHVFDGDHYKSTPGHPLVMGKFLIPTNDPFTGLIGEVRLWNGSRTRRELQQYENVALSGKESGLAACWTFEQTEGRFAYDISGNNNHARLGKFTGPDDADPKWIDLQAPSPQSDKKSDLQVGLKNEIKTACQTSAELMDNFLELARNGDPAAGRLFAENIAPDVKRLLEWWGGEIRCREVTAEYQQMRTELLAGLTEQRKQFYQKVRIWSDRGDEVTQVGAKAYGRLIESNKSEKSWIRTLLMRKGENGAWQIVGLFNHNKIGGNLHAIGDYLNPWSPTIHPAWGDSTEFYVRADDIINGCYIDFDRRKLHRMTPGSNLTKEICVRLGIDGKCGSHESAGGGGLIGIDLITRMDGNFTWGLMTPLNVQLAPSMWMGFGSGGGGPLFFKTREGNIGVLGVSGNVNNYYIHFKMLNPVYLDSTSNIVKAVQSDPREVAAYFLTGSCCRHGELDVSSFTQRPEIVAKVKNHCRAFGRIRLDTVHTTNNVALATTSKSSEDKYRRFVLYLSKENNRWLVTDVQIETKEDEGRALRDFLKDNPDTRLYTTSVEMIIMPV